MFESQRLCIVGTDTDAGKTIVTGALARAAWRLGLKPLVLKPVQTGCWRDPAGHLQAPDCAVHREACPEAECLSLVQLEDACSPHLAAGQAGLRLSASDLAGAIAQRIDTASAGLTLIEGAGGLLTPLNETETLLDVFAPLGAPFVLVAANRLGMLNHALLTVELLRARDLPMLGFILTRPTPGEGSDLDRRIRADNGETLSRMTGLPCLAELPFIRKLQNSDSAVRAQGWEAATQIFLESAGERGLNAGGRGRKLLKKFSSPSPRAPHPYPSKLFSLGTERGEDSSLFTPGQTLIENKNDDFPPHPETQAKKFWGKGDGGVGEGEHPLLKKGVFPFPHISPSISSDLLRFDREHVWHPYTSALAPMRTREAVGTDGVRIRLRSGEELIDGMASWWCAVHGYRHPALMRALQEQAGRMPHVMFGGLTHEPAVDLARKLLELAPSGLERVFFSDSGSVAVEVAIKMAVQYQRATGHPKRSRLLTVRGGYHGDTLGAMSVCDPENGMHTDFSGILPRQVFAPRPSCRFDADYDPASATAFEAVLKEQAGEVAAVILEPVLQGAGGMWMYHPEYLRRVSELCREHGCLLILDEIATGFGRTGRMFACEWAGVEPDILCLGKALTGGVMTLAATLATKEVAEGISQQGGVLMHGPTFMGNPLACAVAGASLDLLSGSGWKADVDSIERALRQGLEPCKELPGVADARVLGAVGVLEMERPVAVEKLQNYFVRQGVWLRPFGRLVYVMPPYVIADDELDQLTLAMRGAVEEKQWE